MGLCECIHLDRSTVKGSDSSGNGTPTDVNDSNAHYPPHTHAGLTTHLVLSGELTLTYPGEDGSRKHVCGPGARFDVKAHQKHEVWVGSSGCTVSISRQPGCAY